MLLFSLNRWIGCGAKAATFMAGAVPTRRGLAFENASRLRPPFETWPPISGIDLSNFPHQSTRPVLLLARAHFIGLAKESIVSAVPLLVM